MTATQVSPMFQQKPVEGLRLGLKTMLGRAYPRLMSVIREPDWILYEIILPLLREIAFVLVYKALKAPTQYAGFVILGGALLPLWLNVLWMMAAQLPWQRLSANLQLYLTTPPPFLSFPPALPSPPTPFLLQPP